MTEMIVVAPVETVAESLCYLNKPSRIGAFHMTLVEFVVRLTTENYIRVAVNRKCTFSCIPVKKRKEKNNLRANSLTARI